MATSPSSARRGEANGFDFTAAIRRTCVDMASRLPELAHIDMSRVAVGFCQARKPVSHGFQASLTPLRFEMGAEYTIRRGRRYACQRLYDDRGREYLYLLNFYLPRFLNNHFGEKVATITHELWHIGPAMDGDLRRYEGRYYAHGPSQREFDRTASRLAAAWLACPPPAETYDYLHHDFAGLYRRYGGIVGQRFTAPKLLPVGRPGTNRGPRGPGE
jgi:hypothetical protein